MSPAHGLVGNCLAKWTARALHVEGIWCVRAAALFLSRINSDALQQGTSAAMPANGASLSWAKRAQIAAQQPSATGKALPEKAIPQKLPSQLQPSKPPSTTAASSSAASASKQEHMIIEHVKRLLRGTWEGDRGEQYKFTFHSDSFWLCKRWNDDGDTKDFPVRWDQESLLVRWGQTCYLDPKDLVAATDVARWYGQKDVNKIRPRFVWRRRT